MKHILLLGIVPFVLSGCFTFGEVRTQYVNQTLPITFPADMLRDCYVSAFNEEDVPDVDEDDEEAQDARENYLFDHITDIHQDMSECNLNMKALRDLQDQRIKAIEAANLKARQAAEAKEK